MNRKWSSFSPVFRRFLISYLAVLIIPLIAGFASYWTSIDAAKISSIENSKKTLTLSKVTLERRLMEVEAFTKQMAVNQDLTRLILEPKPLDPNNVVGLGRMQRSLVNFSSTNDYLANFFIYFNNYNVILTPAAVFFRPEHYYELNQLGDLTFAEWESSVLKRTHLNEIIPLRAYSRNVNGTVQRRSSAITFVQSLPINSFSNPQATVAVMIDEAKLGEMLHNIVEQYGGWALVTDRDGETIISEGIEAEEIGKLPPVPSGDEGDTGKFVDGELLISMRSDINGWLYTAGIPERAIMDKANRIKRVIGTLTVAAAIVGLLIGLLLAYRNSAPINRMLSLFREQEAGQPRPVGHAYDFDFLAGNISNLIADNKSLAAELNEQLPYLRDAFIKQLLNGEFYSVREIDSASSQTGVTVGSDRGHVAVLRIDGYGGMDSEESFRELSVARLFVRQALLARAPDLLLTDWGSDKIAVVFQEESGESRRKLQSIEEVLLTLLETVYAQYRLSVNIGLGSLYTVLHDVSRSFAEALQALEYAAHIGAAGMIRYEDTIREAAMYDYPLDTEQRLLNTLKAGDFEEGSRTVERLFARNFEERELSYEMTQQFIVELKGTLLKLTEQHIFFDAGLADRLRSSIVLIQPTDGVAQLKDKFLTLIRHICDDIARKKSDMLAETVQTMVRYIEEQYGNPDLSVYRIAEMIGRPEKYISQLFKEYIGENLSEYVELVRINKAAELLFENRLTIDEIAVHVGYNSAHSFRRAFKRVRGVTPTAYRQTGE